MSELWTERVVNLHMMVFISIILDALFRRKVRLMDLYEGWNFSSGNYLFTTDTK